VNRVQSEASCLPPRVNTLRCSYVVGENAGKKTQQVTWTR